MDSQNHREYKQQKQLIFQNQCIAKAIDNTKTTRNNIFQNQWVTKAIENTKTNKQQYFITNG